MPNFYAHIRYGQSVYEALPAALQQRLEPELDAFYYGLSGPDPLMFWPTTVQAARMVHRQPGMMAVDCFRDAIQAHMPMALGYTAGFFCHFMLDCACHPYVIANATRHLNHTAMEVEFDRILSLAAGQAPRSQRPIPRLPAPGLVSRVAVLPYGGKVRPVTYRMATRCFYRASAMLTWSQGTVMRNVINGIGHLPGCSKVLGAVPGKEPAPHAPRHAAELIARMEDAVAPGAEIVCAVLAGDATLPDILNRNFYGVDPIRGYEDELTRMRRDTNGENPEGDDYERSGNDTLYR